MRHLLQKDARADRTILSEALATARRLEADQVLI
jgi:hypothetical protein